VKAILGKLISGLRKTREGLVGKLNAIVNSFSDVNDELFEKLEETLIASDIGVNVSMKLVEDIRKKALSSSAPTPENILNYLKSAIRAILIPNGNLESEITFDFSIKPLVIMVVGVNGTGKTTTIGKLASLFKQQGKKVLLAAADTFRAAAGEQLEIWAQRSGVDIILQQEGADPAAVAYDSLNAAINRGVDVVIIDTAGRLHTKVNLMEELKKINRVLKKLDPTAPHETLLALDANTGQNGLSQARQFTETVGITGIILTKLDGTAKGGIILAIRDELGVPIKFIGVGEQIDDLQPFDPEKFIEALFQ
jgi:fused signal recognition particle receptor